MPKEAQEFLKKLTKEQLDKLKEQANVGQSSHEPYGRWFEILKPKPPKKQKWETVIRRWVQAHMKENIEPVERWDFRGGRYALLEDKVKIPFEQFRVTDVSEKNKINLMFFLDTSGSCAGYAQRFWTAAQTIPTDRFNIKMAYFDDVVTPASMKDKKIRIGMGTNFGILERYCKTQPKYPDAIFVITDGFGTAITPEHPERWHWFLTERNSKNCIPNKSKTYKLGDYE
jgi:hypothetical protein